MILINYVNINNGFVALPFTHAGIADALHNRLFSLAGPITVSFLCEKEPGLGSARTRSSDRSHSSQSYIIFVFDINNY